MFLCLLIHVLLVFLFSSCGTCSMGLSGTLPGCPDKCGDVTIPYPFGISSGCSLSSGFDITCNDNAYNPRKPFGGSGNIDIFNITDDVVIVNLPVAASDECDSGISNGILNYESVWAYFDGDQYAVSQTRNILIAIGCNTLAYVYDNDDTRISSCASDCNNMPNTTDVGPCSGHNGCCQSNIPNSLKSYNITLSKNNESSTQTITNCSRAFLVDKDQFKYNPSYIKSFNQAIVPVVLDWVIENRACDVAETSTDYACRDNTRCVNSTDGLGYRCSCLDGYQGNPYLLGGCQDIDECASPKTHNCSFKCENTLGSYNCLWPLGGYNGDGNKNGTGCTKSSKLVEIVLGCALGFLILLILPVGI